MPAFSCYQCHIHQCDSASVVERMSCIVSSGYRCDVPDYILVARSMLVQLCGVSVYVMLRHAAFDSGVALEGGYLSCPACSALFG